MREVQQSIENIPRNNSKNSKDNMLRNSISVDMRVYAPQLKQKH